MFYFIIFIIAYVFMTSFVSFKMGVKRGVMTGKIEHEEIVSNVSAHYQTQGRLFLVEIKEMKKEIARLEEVKEEYEDIEKEEKYYW